MNDTLSKYGTVLESGTIRFERLLPGPIDRVWAYLTDSEKRGKWLASGSMELRVGGRVELNFHHADLSAKAEPTPDKYKKYENGVSQSGRVTRCEPPKLLSFMWAGEKTESEVTFELSERGADVLLVLTHRRLDRAGMLSVGPGWHAHLGVLEDHLRGATAAPFWSTFMRLEQEYAQRI